MSPATGARRRAREVAFRVAYQADIAGDAYPVAWGLRREQEEKLTADQLELIEDVVTALEQRRSEVDGELQTALEGWVVARLAATDRAVLRVAVAELLSRPGSPARVVLADAKMRGADDMVCLGDFVGYGASPNECIERLEPLIELAVLGNHDQAVFDPSWLENFNEEAATAARWTTTALRREHLEYLRGLPYSLSWNGVRLVHASPADPEAWNYVFTPQEAVMEMDSCTEPVCFVGHSHYPGTFELQNRHAAYTRDKKILGRRDRRYLIVVPSVGQPRDGDPRAGYLLWDDEAWTFEHVRLEYDLEAAIRRIEAAGLPRSLGERLRWGE